MKTDSQLQHDVMEELKWDPKVEHSRIGVAAREGVVTLTGFVPNYAQKLAAEKAARRVFGVRGVAQEIEVRFADDPKTSDAEIAGRILDIFKWDVTIPDQRLTVKVEHGWVTLSGQVDWNFEKAAAYKAASRIGGVKAIANMIEVRAKASAIDLRERIEAAFKRSSEVDANAIAIRVDGSKVKLTGRVHGWNERRIAENAAWSAPGVTEVEDDIVLA
jgi:osmotically-inducible protein OsmY